MILFLDGYFEKNIQLIQVVTLFFPSKKQKLKFKKKPVFRQPR